MSLVGEPWTCVTGPWTPHARIWAPGRAAAGSATLRPPRQGLRWPLRALRIPGAGENVVDRFAPATHHLAVDLSGLEQAIVGPLVRTLTRTTNSYKFLFLKAILDALNITGRSTTVRNPIPLWELYGLVFINAWYPVSRFRLSLGTADPIPKYVHAFQEAHDGDVKVDARSTVPLFSPVGGEPDLMELGAQLDRYVKYRFVRPWLEGQLVGVPDGQVNAKIFELLEADRLGAQACPYHFLPGSDGYDVMVISQAFVEYLTKNGPIIYDWWRWKFASFLATRNPYTPNILAKLEAPLDRDLTLARFYWKHIQVASGGLNCIYTGRPLGTNVSIDHFIPWSFVAHDRFWNLVPTDPSVNSSKSDCLPNLDIYLEPFLALHKQSLSLAGGNALPDRINSSVIQGEYRITDTQESLMDLWQRGDQDKFTDLYTSTLESLWAGARNQGFPVWVGAS